MGEYSEEVGREVVAMCRGVGFALAGVCAAGESGRSREMMEWLNAGKHGSMGWMERAVEVRLDSRRLIEGGEGGGARSVIVVGDVYVRRGEENRSESGSTTLDNCSESSSTKETGTVVGKIARYARGDDYHVVMKRRLHALADALRARFPGEEFRAFVDTAPVLEREHGARAGLGWVGKNTLLINPALGSYFFLGGVATTMAIAPPVEQRVVTDHCGTCTRCIDACPTGAIAPYSVDATRCVSYLTIEHRGEIAPELHEGIGEWLYGCDVCQEVCPHNSARRGDGASDAAPVDPAYVPRREGFDVLEVLGWTEEDRRAAFARSAMKRAKLEMMRRNAGIVGGNVGKADKSSPARGEAREERR